MSDKTLVLDLDSTLIFAWGAEPEWKYDFTISGGLWVTKRPHLDEFLKYSLKNFKVGIWTAKSKMYATEIVKSLKVPMSRLSFIYHGAHCNIRYTREEVIHLKPLKKLKNYDPSKFLIVDDNPSGCTDNVDNHIHIKQFYTDPDDNELLKLMNFLEKIKDVDDVRSVDKTRWRNS